jgi:hypothetical protein
MMRFIAIALGWSAWWLTGCSSPRERPPPVVVVAPAEAPPAAEPPPEPSRTESVYHNPKIGMVYLRAYQDAAGRLFGPQVMYQVTDPGSWNVDAIEQGKATIAAANLETPPDLDRPQIRPAREAPGPPPPGPLLDPATAARTTITGLSRPEDKPRAEALAQEAGGHEAVFDDQVGWLLVPRK